MIVNDLTVPPQGAGCKKENYADITKKKGEEALCVLIRTIIARKEQGMELCVKYYVRKRRGEGEGVSMFLYA